MPALRTEITEIVTGLALFGVDSLESCMAAAGPPPGFEGVDGRVWSRLVDAHAEREHRVDFLAAWNNGRAFLAADDGLRGRPPRLVEWTGGHRDPGDSVVPADLRIDHVYLVSCKYLSKVLHNASPEALFDRCLAGGAGRSSRDWFDVVAPAEHQELYQVVRRVHGEGLELPEAVGAMSAAQRRSLRAAVPREWDPACSAAYGRLSAAASERSAQQWRTRLGTERERTAMLWRLLRLSPAPYFVLGTSPAGVLRLRVGTPWDFNRTFRIRSFEVAAQPGGQPRVGWTAWVTERDSGEDRCVEGHVEIRWSHGRFGGPPEAKVYLDSPITETPGYWPLA